MKNFSMQEILKTQFNYNQEQINRFLNIERKLGSNLSLFLDGKIFDGPEYTEKEKTQIIIDLKLAIDNQNTNILKNDNQMYISTAGAPGSGKTYYIEALYGQNPENAIYVAPDRIGSPALTEYRKDLKEKGEKYAYTKWRDASNFISNFMLVKAITDKTNIIHDTTATNERIPNILKILKEEGYKIHFELVFADNASKAKALNHRAENSAAQVTKEDAINKIKPIFTRMHDSYFKYSDSMNIHVQTGEYWLGKGKTVCVATYNKDKGLRFNVPNKDLFVKQLEQQMKESLNPEQINEVTSQLGDFKEILLTEKNEMIFSFNSKSENNNIDNFKVKSKI